MNGTPTPVSSRNIRARLFPILAITVGFDLALGRLLLLLGLESLVLRNGIVFPITYGMFFLCVHFWRQRTSNFTVDLDEHKAANKPRTPKKRSWLDFLYFDLGEATIILAAIIGIIWFIVWIFGEAPAIMAEAFFDVGLTATLAAALRARNASPWYVGLFRKTIGAFIAFYLSSAVLLLVAHKTCPDQPTLSKIVHECWMK